jgi:hypothetical protein
MSLTKIGASYVADDPMRRYDRSVVGQHLLEVDAQQRLGRITCGRRCLLRDAVAAIVGGCAGCSRRAGRR